MRPRRVFRVQHVDASAFTPCPSRLHTRFIFLPASLTHLSIVTVDLPHQLSGRITIHNAGFSISVDGFRERDEAA